MRHFLKTFAVLAALAAGSAQADGLEPREGWEVFPTQKSYGELVEAVKAAATGNGMAVVTEAGPTDAAAQRGVTIPGNRVIGVFNNEFAVKILETSTAAMIEAPLRFYVTENEDGTATLAYKKPSFVFLPYSEEGGVELIDLAAQLDASFAGIASEAVK